MKLRKRKKAYDCSHHVYEDFLVTDDPYPIHNTEDYCKLGKYDNTWLAPEKKVTLCDHCNRFCASRPMIRKQRERKTYYKEAEREWNRYYCAAVRAGVAQNENEDGFLDLNLVL
jgi:hypothetical protein